MPETYDEIVDAILDQIEQHLDSVPEPERSARIQSALDYAAKRWPEAEE